MPFAAAAFLLAMLSTVLFDGLLGSAYWIDFEDIVHELNPRLDDAAWLSLHTGALIAIWAVFLGLFLGTCEAMRRLGDNRLSAIYYARVFAPTLIPIVIGYHFAHTFTYLLVQGQGIVSLISDPFGIGWDLFGTTGHKIDLTIMSTKSAWYLAVSAIVVGHVVSIYLAHVAAERLMSNRRTAVRSLVPMTILMVFYTIVSLTILAEPLVKYRGPNNEIVMLSCHEMRSS